MPTYVSPVRREDSSVESVKVAHQRLIEQLESDPSILIEGSPAREDWLAETDDFLGKVRVCVASAREGGNAGDLEWLARAASEWQLVMSRRLNLPRDVRCEFGLEPDIVERAESKTIVPPKATWNRTFIEQDLKREAFYIGANRKILALMRRYRQLQQMQAHRIHAEVHSNDKECWQDWYDACRFLTLDVILGRIDFARLVDASAYEFFDTVWLEDVKQLQAYLLWEANAEGGFREETPFYYAACEQIDQRIFNHTSDVSVDTLLQWWKERFLTGTKSGPALPNAIVDIVHRKAQRLWEVTRNPDANGNWLAAKNYVEAFYYHIVPAVKERDVDAVKIVHKAMTGASYGPLLITGLEAAIVSSFVDFSCIDKD